MRSPNTSMTQKSISQTDSAGRLVELKRCRTLSEFIPLRAAQIPDKAALRQFDRTASAWAEVSYAELNRRIQEWRKALAAGGLARGARVAVLLNNSVDAVTADQAVLANALIPVPLHAIDTPGSSAFIIADSGAECLITNKLERWKLIESAGVALPEREAPVRTNFIR